MRRLLLAWGSLHVCFALLGQSATAQQSSRSTATTSETNPAIPAAGHSLHGEAFNDGPRQEAHKLEGMGISNFSVTTKSKEAQSFINQGVAQLHSFYYYESERSFRQAAKLDPECSMAYWGMAMSNVNNARRARGFLKEARKRDKSISRRERLYLDALEALHAEQGDSKSRKKNHLLGLETLVQEFPDDIDARAWMAMVTWQNASNDGIGSRQAVDLVIESVLQAEPMHPGAHHYRIHLWDNVKPERALKSAALYATTALGIAHAWHMPGHTYTGLKRYADAAYQQEGSARVDHASMLRDRIMPFEIHNYAHNNQWLSTSLSHVGRVRDAIAVARNLVEQPRDPSKNTKNDGGSSQRSGRARWSEILCRYELWDDLIEATNSGALDWSDVKEERRQKAYTLGLAYAAKGQGDKLAEQVRALRTLEAEEAKPSNNRGQTPPANASTPKPLTPTQLAIAELEGYENLAKRDWGAAFEQFAKATNMRPESLARAHLTARNYGFAESTARKAVQKQLNQVPPLAAEVEILHAVGKVEEAKKAYAKLKRLAPQADHALPVFQRLEKIASAWEPMEAPSNPKPTDDATASRINLNTLGSLTWAPYNAKPFELDDTTKKTWSLDQRKKDGKNVILLFYLGGKCAHCMQQLQLFGQQIEAFKKLNTEIVAISTDDFEATRALKNNSDDVKFPMPFLADPKLQVFKDYGAFDDFEDQPLHGTFLIDSNGKIRFQRVSADPFLDTTFLKAETSRVNSLNDAKGK